MYPDFVVVRQDGQGLPFDILEPHDASRSDNHWKALGLAKFAERHWHLFGRIQLIRENRSGDGKPYITRLDMNDESSRTAVPAVQSNEQLDDVFLRFAKSG